MVRPALSYMMTRDQLVNQLEKTLSEIQANVDMLHLHPSATEYHTSPETKFAQLSSSVLDKHHALKAKFDTILDKLVLTEQSSTTESAARALSSPPNQPPCDPLMPMTSECSEHDISPQTSLSLSSSPEMENQGRNSPISPRTSLSLSSSPEMEIQKGSSPVPPQPQLSLPERFNLIRSIGEECVQEDELQRLLANKSQIICYDGFEPSGRMHIAQGVLKAINVNKLTSAGCKVKLWIADWFALTNHKMGGDLKKIQVVGEYIIEIWKALGMNIDDGQVEFLWASQEISARADEYWPLVMDIAMKNTLSRITRCCQIMGRSEKYELSAAQIFYPCMQCADIFFLKADICQMGMDQRKVNMLAREYCDNIGRKDKPIILSHHMLPGLQEGQLKMSKSDPSSSIFMEDEEADVNLKIKKAFCPPKVVENNPCLEYIKYIIFPWFNQFVVERKPVNGGHTTFTSFEDLVTDYESGALHPGDLKPALAKALNCILQPVRDHFKRDVKAKKLLNTVKSYKVTGGLMN